VEEENLDDGSWMELQVDFQNCFIGFIKVDSMITMTDEDVETSWTFWTMSM
jgi:hypothetical protein